MAKDPAVLLYTSDFLTGTAMFTDAQVGKYIRLLCLQHQSGGIPVDYFNSIVGDQNCPIRLKFILFEDGVYRNIRMKEEAEKRKNFVASRRNNLKKDKEPSHMKPHMSPHTADRMENENEDDNVIEDMGKGGVGEKGEEPPSFFNQSINDQLWKENLMKATKLSMDDVDNWIVAFSDYVNSTSETFQIISQWRKYCTNWIKLEFKKQKSNGTKPSRQSATVQDYKDKYGELFKGEPNS